MRRVPLVASAALVACALMAAGCGDGINEGANEGRGPRGTIDGVVLQPPTSIATDTSSTGVPATDPPAPGDPFAWEQIDTGLDEGYLDVPLDWTQPDGDTITLYLVRHTATDPAHRIGTLLVNPGGPGFGGTDLAVGADGTYGADLLARFDIIGGDLRGTGLSEPRVDCIDDYDHYFAVDSSPDTEAERTALIDLGKEFGAACQRKNADLLPFLSTADSARDMDAIRKALHEPTISYFGFSYGSELGATWATLFPHTVRAMVIDGAVDPTVDYLHQNLQQAAGFEATFNTFLAECSRRTSCAFHNGGDAEGAFDRLNAAVDAAPVPSGRPGRPDVTQGVLTSGIAQAMYDRSGWTQLEQALADLQHGDGGPMLDLYDQYYGYYQNQWDDSLEAYFAIGCLDDHGSTGPDDLYAHDAEFAEAAPRLGRSWLAELTFCSVWPQPPAPPMNITGKGAGPIVVVGTTGDPATPLASTRHMADALEDGHLLIVQADQHTGYGTNACVDDTVDGYLLDPAVELPVTIDCT
jgi:pimeloyl-ACP methyl ester carboxylesterase